MRNHLRFYIDDRWKEAMGRRAFEALLEPKALIGYIPASA